MISFKQKYPGLKFKKKKMKMKKRKGLLQHRILVEYQKEEEEMHQEMFVVFRFKCNFDPHKI